MKYPEHEKLKAVKEKSQAIGEFMDWVENEHRAVLCIPHRHTPHCNGPSGCGLSDGEFTIFYHGGMQKILAEFFGIDLDELESEKLKMLDDCRLAHKAVTGG